MPGQHCFQIKLSLCTAVSAILSLKYLLCYKQIRNVNEIILFRNIISNVIHTALQTFMHYT